MDGLTGGDIAQLQEISPGGVICNISLAEISQWQIGGIADLLIQPTSQAEIIELLQWFYNRDIKPVIIGLTSNLLFSDEGIRVPIIQVGTNLNAIQIMGTEVVAEAGVWVPSLARKLMQHSLTGGEHVSGIPGTLGGLICMNGGSKQKGIADNIVWVESVDRSGRLYRRSVEDCDFAYRRSIFQNNNEIVVGAKLKFSHSDRNGIRRDMLNILRDRRKKFPRKKPNCGSVFKSNPAMYSEFGPPGKVIEELGFKGMKIGGAQVSDQHANFIVNTGEAKAKDVKRLIKNINDAVFQKTGFYLEREAIFFDELGKSE
ncbi:UDP-N-acetylmuramate dehydrogenase [Marinobacter sp. HL-58]|uniref:UDP-N-acetylmuramate dehydrogenase n=1 Tax=Marinobacter sp. HL-58 TaxID=1479237 RepID=UPI0004868769|nr:UDP-N-acetylmuramate dehydrogenase [Marinobacter sp. HL-58]